MTLDDIIQALIKKRADLGRGDSPVSIAIHSFNGIFADPKQTQLEIDNITVESYMDGEIVTIEGEARAR